MVSRTGAGRSRGAQGYPVQGTQPIGQGYAGQRSGYASQQGAARYQAARYGSGPGGRVPARKHRGGAVKVTVIVVLALVIAVGVFAGITGHELYESAKTVKADAAAVMTDISDLKDQILDERADEANATAADIAARARNMKEETSGWSWNVASYVPFFGSDIAKAREVADVLDGMADEAIVPLVGKVSQISLKNLLSDGAINVELADQAIQAINEASPVIERSAARLDALGSAGIEEIEKPLAKARESLDTLNALGQFVSSVAPTFTDMLGADGQRRTYLIVAQNNSEIRSTGGFLGSIGALYIDNGKIEMGGFQSIKGLYPSASGGIYAPITAEELDIFGPHVSWQIADANFIPDWGRVSNIVKYAWEAKGLGSVDGVIGVDPVFLQHMLGLAGAVTTSNGTVVDGSNAATLLLHEAYYLPSKEQDPFFEEVAALSFHQLMTHLGDISLTKFAKVLQDEIEARRIQVWMNLENEQMAIEMLGADGRLPHDKSKPVLGVYFIDESYSKLFWYLKVETTVGDPTTNADGSKTYPVTMTYRNMLGDESELSNYMGAHSSIARSKGDMICWVMLSAPYGGSITDMACTEGTFMPEDTRWRTEGSYVSGDMTETSLQELDFWYGLTRSLPGESFSLSFNVTTAPEATEALTVMRTPNAQEVAGW